MAPKLSNEKGGDVADSSTGTKKIRRRLRKSNGEALESEKMAHQINPGPAKVDKEAEPSSLVKIKHDANKRKRSDEGKHDIDGKNDTLHQREKENKLGNNRHEERKEKKTGDGRQEGRKEKKMGDGRYEGRKENKIGDGRLEGRKEKKTGDGRYEGRKEKKIGDGRHEGRKETERKSGASIAGAIFMCNTKTKPDCFRYRVMGVSSGNQHSVMRIRPGLKLFLYDFDLRIMYGIFEASSGGGMKLERAAFGGAFPAQVRFKIHRDCLPLPEAVFKKAISYDDRTHKFKTELTGKQVERLTELFRPVPLLRSNPESVQASIVQYPPPFPSEGILQQQNHRERHGSKLQQGSTPVVDHNGHYHMNDAGHSQHPLFLTEREYRSYGLRAERQVLPNTDPASSSGTAPSTHTYENFRYDYGGEPPQNNHPSITNNAASVQNEQGCPSLLFLNEQDYRAFGLKGVQELPGKQTPEDSMKGAYNPYDDSTASLVSRYLTLPGPDASTAETYYPPGSYGNASWQASEQRDLSIRFNPEIERLHAPYVPRALSNENRHYHQLGGNPDLSTMSVSSRYSFGGPSLSQR